MVRIFEVICKIVGLLSCSINIWDKIHAYIKKDPSGDQTNDGSEHESYDS